MKKFFKALALVLALTLVVGSIPAAAAETYSTKKKAKTLYVATTEEIAKDKNAVTTLGKNLEKGTSSKYKARASYASFFGIKKKEAKKLDITTTVKLSADTAEGAIVANDETQAVRVYGIGEAVVTFKVNGQSAGSVTITAKKSATQVIFGQAFKDAKDEFKAETFAEYNVSIPRSKGGEKLDTDQRRIIVKDADGKDVTADVATPVQGKDRLWTLKFTKGGTYTVIGEAFQSEKNYPSATATASIKVVVSEGTLDNAIQTKYNAFDLVFSNENSAKVAVDNTKPSLNTGTANVTEAEDIIKVFEIGANNEEIAAFISALSQKTAEKNVVTVTMFADLKENTTYKVQYGEYVRTFKAADYIPESIKGYEKSYSPVDDGESQGGTAELATIVYSVGDQDQNVDITDKVSDLGNPVYSDPNAAKNDYTKYSFNGDTVDFYVNDYTIDAHVLFTYFGGTTAVDFENDFKVSSSDERTFTILNYLMDSDMTSPNPGDKREAFISADDSTMLLDVRIKSEIVIDGNTTVLSDQIFGNNDNVKFVTSNTDKLAVEKETGKAYAPKAAKAEVAVWVYYGDKIVDADASVDGVQPIYVTVYDHKKLGTATITSTTDGKIGYSTSVAIANTKYDAAPYAEDFENFKIVATDEQGRPYEDVTVYVEKQTDVANGQVAVQGTYLLDSNGAKDYAMSALNNDWYTYGTKFIKFTAQPTSTSVQTLGYKITVCDNNSDKKVASKISFKIKNTNDSEVKKFVVDADGSAYTARVLGYDNNGYPVCIYVLDSSANQAAFKASTSTKLYVGFFKGTDGSEVAHSFAGTTKVAMTTVAEVDGGGLTKLNAQTLGVVTDGAINVGVTTQGAIGVAKRSDENKSALAYIDAGTYTVRAYRVDGGKLVGVASSTLNYAPSTYYDLSWTWKTAYTSETDPVKVINEALTFTFAYKNYRWYGDTYTLWNKTLQQLINEGVPVSVSYTEKDDSITILYAYIDISALEKADGSKYEVLGDPLYRETSILRTIYTDIEK
jgi:hypothetical protein